MEKLVRDRIPEIMRAAGVQPVIRYVRPDERFQWLCAKLYEEAGELERTPSLDECADVLEVLCSIAATLGHSLEEVVRAAETKRAARGAFKDGCILTVQE
jgi:predicted house-cleaning noncanonical NTP pyrophosphatase (MazG superfamily)